jgi:hypothetical protein
MTNPLDEHLAKLDRQTAGRDKDHDQRVADAVEARGRLIALLTDFVDRMKKFGGRGLEDCGKKTLFKKPVRAYRVHWSFSEEFHTITIDPERNIDTYRDGKTRWVPLSSLEIFGVDGQGREIGQYSTAVMHGWATVTWKSHLDGQLKAAGEEMARIIQGARP